MPGGSEPRRVRDHAAKWELARGTVVRAVQEFFRDGCTHLAASIAFRVLFSLFPLALVLAAVFGIVSGAAGFRPDVIDAIVRNVPLDDDGTRRLREILEEAAENSSVGLFAAVGLVWAASGMMAAARAALNRAWDVEDERPWLVGKAVDVLLVFGTSLVIVASLALNLTVRLAQELVAEVGIGVGVAQALLGLGVPFLLAFLVVLAVYRLVPAVSQPLSELVVPALFVGAVFTAAQTGFVWYLENVGRYNVIYGSLGAVVAFMFFVYLAALVFLFGAELAASSPRVRDQLRRAGGRRDENPQPLAERVKEVLRGLVMRSPG